MLLPVFNLCLPRPEVLSGDLREDVFAARLKDVLDNKAEPVYGDPVTFFDNTYPTAGLKTLLTDAVGRLIGNAAGKNAIIRLETAFGGGKTHNLIALYHVISGATPARSVANLLGPQVTLPRPGQVRIAGVVGSDLDPTVGLAHPQDHIKTLTLWGELAYQLGGRAGYALAKESDENKSAPGTGLFEALIGDGPALIMLDELARHLRSALAVPTVTGKSTLADQVTAFLMSLLEFAASKERCLVVLTLAGQNDAFSQETELLRHRLAEALRVSARQERVLTPTDEGEISAIVTHRLFKSVDRAGAQPVFEAYAQYYARLLERNADVPQRCTRAEYLKELADAYPFHPELLTVLNRKTATIPNFNQTRGALRLLAWTVRALWQRQPIETWLIHPHQLDLAEAQIAEDLTSRLDRPKFKQVIEADIVSPMPGMQAHAQTVDQALIASGKPPYARRLASTIFLHSLTQGIASGVDPADLMLAVVQPEDDPAVIGRALERLYDQAWFLEYDGHRYRFKTEPSLNKIIADETANVGPSKAKVEIENRIRQIWKKGYFKPEFFPVEPGEVDDDAEQPRLVLMHFEAVKTGPAESLPPDLVRKIFEYKGTLEAFRTYQNNLVFLVADTDQAENMIEVARRYLAVGRIVGDAERLAEFNEEQKKTLKKMQEAAELDVRVAITKAYRYLYYPTPDAPKSAAYLRRETLPAQEQGEVDKDQSNVALRVLKSLKKVLTADDELLSAAYVRSKAWDQHQTSMTTDDLRQTFARKIGLRILLDIGQLKKTIENGVKTGTWIYYDATEQFGYDCDTPPSAWRIAAETILYLPDEAARLKIRIKGKWQPDGRPSTSLRSAQDAPDAPCPVCGRPEKDCICGVVERTPTKFSGQGAVPQAFQQIIDASQERQVARLRQVFITVESSGKQGAADVRAVGLALPQFGKGRFTIELHLIATFANRAESFEQTYTGGWERYKRLKNLIETFAQEADELKVSLRVGVESDGGLALDGQEYATMREVLSTLGLGKILIEAMPL